MNEIEENIKVNSKAIQSGLWSIACTFIQATTSFLTMPIFTRLLSPDDYGMVTNYNSWYTILLPVCSMCLYVSVNKAIYDFSDEIDKYISSQLFLTVLVVSITYIIVPQLIDFRLPRSVIRIMFFSFLSSSAFNMFSILQRFRFKYKLLSCFTVTIVLGDILLSYILIKYISIERYLSRIIGQSVTSIVIGILLLLFFFWKSQCFINLQFWKYGLKIGLPMIFHMIGMQILNQSDRIMINKICGSYDAGLYSVPYSICNILVILWTSVTNGLVPWIYTKLYLNAIEEIYDITRKMVKVISFVVISFIAMAPLAMHILADEKYQEGINCIPAIAFGMYFMCMYNMFVTIENFHKKTIYIAVCTVSAAIINLLLNLLLIPVFGYHMASYTTMFCYVLLAILHFNVSRKIDERRIFPIRDMVGYGILIIGVGSLLEFLYDYWMARYLIYIFYTIIFFIYNRADLKHFIVILKKDI